MSKTPPQPIYQVRQTETKYANQNTKSAKQNQVHQTNTKYNNQNNKYAKILICAVLSIGNFCLRIYTYFLRMAQFQNVTDLAD